MSDGDRVQLLIAFLAFLVLGGACVAASIMWRRRVPTSIAATESEPPPSPPPPVVSPPRPARPPIPLSRRLLLLSTLRFPPAKASAATLAVIMPVSLLLAWPRRSSGHYGGLAEMALQFLIAAGTVSLAGLAIVLVIVFWIRPAPVIAVTYAWAALAIAAGGVNLLLLGDWREALDLIDLDWAAPVLISTTSIAALTPAVVGQVVHAVRWYREIDEPVWRREELEQPAFADTTRFIWLVAVPALPGLLVAATSGVFGLMMAVGARPGWNVFEPVAMAGSLWKSVGLMVIVVLAGIGWVAIAKADRAYHRRWKHVMIASVVGWLITAMVWP